MIYTNPHKKAVHLRINGEWKTLEHGQSIDVAQEIAERCGLHLHVEPVKVEPVVAAPKEKAKASKK